MSRYCKKCNEDHLISEFQLGQVPYKLSDGTIKLYPAYRCKRFVKANKNKEKEKQYREENKEAIRIQKKGYREKNIDAIKERDKKYYEKNSSELNKYRSEYQKEHSEEIKIKLEKRLKTTEGTLTNLINRRNEYNKKHGQPCDIDIEYLKLLIETQNSKCIYCQHSLEIMYKCDKLNQISVDRICSDRLYSKDNISITCLFCNLAKNEMEDSMFKKFIEALRGNQYKFEFIEKKDAINKAVKSARESDKRRKFNLDNTITITQAKELLIKQSYKCAISGLEFINVKGTKCPFQISIDRIDNTKGHTLENSQLICLSINYGKLDKNNDDTIKYVKEIMES